MRDLNLLAIDENENLYLDGHQLKNVKAFNVQDTEGGNTLTVTLYVGNGNLSSNPRNTTREIIEGQLDELISRSHQCSDSDLPNITGAITALCGLLV